MGISLLIGGVISAVSSFVASVSGMLAATLPRIAVVLGNAENWRMLGNTISLLAQVFQVFRPNESVEDMGDRALQAAEAGIRPENFDNWDEYVAQIRDLELRPELSTQFSVEDKHAAGLAVAVRALEEKFGLPSGAMAFLPLLVASNPDYFNAERMEAVLRVTKDIASIIDYVDGKLGRADRQQVEETLVRAGGQLDPDKTTEQIRADLAAAVERAAQQGGHKR